MHVWIGEVQSKEIPIGFREVRGKIKTQKLTVIVQRIKNISRWKGELKIKRKKETFMVGQNNESHRWVFSKQDNYERIVRVDKIRWKVQIRVDVPNYKFVGHLLQPVSFPYFHHLLLLIKWNAFERL